MTEREVYDQYGRTCDAHPMYVLTLMCQHQAWPRLYETFGEDPLLVTRMGVAIINGYQGDGSVADLTQPDKVAACMKHFIGSVAKSRCIMCWRHVIGMPDVIQCRWSHACVVCAYTATPTHATVKIVVPPGSPNAHCVTSTSHHSKPLYMPTYGQPCLPIMSSMMNR